MESSTQLSSAIATVKGTQYEYSKISTRVQVLIRVSTTILDRPNPPPYLLGNM